MFTFRLTPVTILSFKELIHCEEGAQKTIDSLLTLELPLLQSSKNSLSPHPPHPPPIKWTNVFYVNTTNCPSMNLSALRFKLQVCKSTIKYYYEKYNSSTINVIFILYKFQSNILGGRKMEKLLSQIAPCCILEISTVLIHNSI